ncbi:hypothetical protein BDAP_001074 [Binucleata daphniae]
MECILRKDLNTKGIFRISANYNELNTTESRFIKMFVEKKTKTDLIDYLMTKDVILLCNLFTRVFKFFSTTLFPQSLIDLALTCFEIEAEEDRVVMMRMIILGFHYHNRQLFESISKFAYIISEQNCKNDFYLTQSMTLNSICKVLAPKIFIKRNKMVDPYKLCNYVDLLEYLFENMEAILQIDPAIEM